MDSLALGHNFGVYEEAQNQQQNFTRQDEDYYSETIKSNLRLINSERIEFSRVMMATGKFIFYMCLTGSLVFLSRILPIFSFAGFVVRVLTFSLLGKEAFLNPVSIERRNFQLVLTAVGLGNIGAEWDAWLSISQAISDFFALFGVLIFAGVAITIAIILLILFRGGGSTEVNTLNTTNVYTDDYQEDQQNDY